MVFNVIINYKELLIRDFTFFMNYFQFFGSMEIPPFWEGQFCLADTKRIRRFYEN